MRVSLIITTYNRPKALMLVLQSIANQTKLPEEVIIADDGSDNNTKELITNFQESSSLNIIYSWQEDKGFRLAKSRNKAIAISNFEYMKGLNSSSAIFLGIPHSCSFNSGPTTITDLPE